MSSVWSLVHDEPMLVVAARQPWRRFIPPFSPFWITAPVGLLMALFVFFHGKSFKPRHGSKAVQLFTHRAAIATDSNAAEGIERLFQSAGWHIAKGFTDLAIHREGIWIHGSTVADRIEALQMLKSIGISAEIDDRVEDIPLQIIVGRETNTALSSTYVGQVSARRVVSPAFSNAPARIDWMPVKPGLAVSVTSRIPEPMENARLLIRDLRWWNDEVDEFVTTDTTHSGGVFQEIALHGAAQLFSGKPYMFTFLSTGVNDSAIRINGFSLNDPSHPQVKLRSGQIGRWRVDFTLLWNGRHYDQSLEFLWDGRMNPTPLNSSDRDGSVSTQASADVGSANEHRHPRIIPVRVYTEKRSLIAVGDNLPSVDIYCANVNFRNDPVVSCPEAEARAVLAEITFRYGGEEVVRIENGRWGDTDQPAVRKAKDPFGSLIDLNTVPFRIGETHELNLAIKHPSQQWIYAFDNSTFNYANWENPAHRLDKDTYEVTVRLRSSHLDAQYRFVIRNLGSGNGLEIKEM